MPNGDGAKGLKPEEERKPQCPFNGRWCNNSCALLVTINRSFAGIVKQAQMCVFVADNIILSEINMKAPPSQQKLPKLTLPGNLRA